MSKIVSNTFCNRRRLLITSTIFVGCFLLLVIGGSIFGVGRFANEFSGVVSCDEFTYDFLKVDLPPNTTILREHCAESFNPQYEITFTMAVDELTIFQQQKYVSEIAAWQSDPLDSWYSESVWQKIEEDLRKQGASLETALYGWYGNGTVAMLAVIDTSSTQQYIVYYSASYVD